MNINEHLPGNNALNDSSNDDNNKNDRQGVQQQLEGVLQVELYKIQSLQLWSLSSSSVYTTNLIIHDSAYKFKNPLFPPIFDCFDKEFIYVYIDFSSIFAHLEHLDSVDTSWSFILFHVS